MKLNQKLKKELGKNLKFNEPLKKWTTFRIGGPAKYFFIAKNEKDLIKAIDLAKKFKIPYFILGNGSNLLVSDKGYYGLVIKVNYQKLEIENCKIIAGAGLLLSELLEESVKRGLTGLEWAIGIPGSVGGAVYQNAGAFGFDFSKIIKNVKVLRNGKIIKLSKKKCGFDYRKSIFQKNKDVILEVEIKLKKGKRKKIQNLIKKYLSYRLKTQPTGFSAGSIFKNCKLKKTFLMKYPQLQIFKKSGIIPAGWLIEKCNLKGKRVGDAKISEKHANFIINKGKAKAKDVLSLIKLIKKEVFKRFKIKLKEEIEKIGFDSHS
jgi:UDP-N-acetylmuramate dehydrogenase